MKRILLTGATGFVGRQVLNSLKRKGVSVSVTLRPGQDVPRGTKPIWTPNLFSESKVFWEKNCTDHHGVIHTAWFTEPGEYLNAPDNLDCLSGTVKLFQGAKAAGISHFQGIGTCLEYDITTKEVRDRKPIASNAPIKPTNPYAAAKIATYLSLCHQANEMGFAWSRIFYLYGEGEDPRRLVPYINRQLSAGLPVNLTSGRQWRDFLDVKVAGDQIADVSLNGLIGPLNICSGNAITVAKLAEKIAQQYDREDLIKLGSIEDRLGEPPYLVGVPSLRNTNEAA